MIGTIWTYTNWRARAQTRELEVNSALTYLIRPWANRTWQFCKFWQAQYGFHPGKQLGPNSNCLSCCTWRSAHGWSLLFFLHIAAKARIKTIQIRILSLLTYLEDLLFFWTYLPTYKVCAMYVLCMLVFTFAHCSTWKPKQNAHANRKKKKDEKDNRRQMPDNRSTQQNASEGEESRGRQAGSGRWWLQ